LRLGRLIRQQKLDMRIARAVLSEEEYNGWDTTYEGTQCFSSCIWAFLGGVRRDVDAGYLAAGQDGTLAVVEDIIALGIDSRLVNILQRTRTCDMTYLDDGELDKYKICWNPDQFMPWKIEAYKQGVVA